MQPRNWMIYGAYGYTGVLLAEEAVRRGHRPLLAGRSADRLRPLAERLGLDWMAVSLDDDAALLEAVKAVSLVLHAAGPFVHTAPPMLRACLAGVTNYLDITGELSVFERVFAASQQAWDRQIALIPGVGFDVVPSDCLLNFVAAQCPDATQLTLAIQALAEMSAGTMNTMIEGLGESGTTRRDGRLQPIPMGRGVRRFRFPNGERDALPLPWGDLVTAYHSTGVPNISTYVAFPPNVLRLMQWTAPLMGLLRSRVIKRWLRAGASRLISGPSAETRQQDRAYVYARAENAQGQAVEAWLDTVEGYRLTAEAAIRAVEHTLAEHPRGACTPAQAFGADFVLEVPGTTRYSELPG